jgi:hypothetical protein
MSGTNVRVLVGQGLKAVSLSPSRTVMGVLAAQSGPAEEVSSSLTLQAQALRHPTPRAQV